MRGAGAVGLRGLTAAARAVLQEEMHVERRHAAASRWRGSPARMRWVGGLGRPPPPPPRREQQPLRQRRAPVAQRRDCRPPAHRARLRRRPPQTQERPGQSRPGRRSAATAAPSPESQCPRCAPATSPAGGNPRMARLLDGCLPRLTPPPGDFLLFDVSLLLARYVHMCGCESIPSVAGGWRSMT